MVNIGATNAARYTFQPGWKWSDCIKPVAGGDLCQNMHLGVAVSGHLHVEHGEESIDIAPGDAFHITPGHDAWVVGDEPYVSYEFELHAATTFGAQG